MPRLNKDILFLIFEELHDDSKSLFSCLMVNRIWCETTIPVLWRNPWQYDINYSNKSYLFTIFTLCLPNKIKESLASEGIQLPSTSSQLLLFDYLSFCRSINVTIMNCIISTRTSSDYDQFLLQQEFYNVLMRKCSELKHLDMVSIKHQIFYFPEAKIRLDSLCELSCDTSIDPSYFYGLASVCKYIQKIIIINTNVKVNHGTVKLIEIQRNLKYFEWKDGFIDEDYIECLDDPYSKIFLALVKHANTLNHFITNFQYEYEFNFDYHYTFMQGLFSEFHKLKTLKFDYPPFSRIDYEQHLRTSTVNYRDLEAFELDRMTVDTATYIIKNSGGCLRKILIHEYYYIDDDDDDKINNDSLNFIRIICENCPLIEYLSLPIFPSSKNHFNEFEKLLEICQKLRSLYFRDTYYQENRLEYVENLLDVLIRAAPSNLRNIGFSYGIELSLKILGEFLEKWRGRPAISIFAKNFDVRGLDYINFISKYKNDGVIKEFVTSLI